MEAVQLGVPGLSPFCSSQVPGLRPGLGLLALEVYRNADEAAKRTEVLREMVDFPLSIACVSTVVGFDLALDEAVAEEPEEPPPASCSEQPLVFSFEGRQGIELQDGRALRSGASRRGTTDVRYTEIMDETVGGLTRGQEITAVRLSGDPMVCRVHNFERVFWGYERAESVDYGSELACSATRLVVGCPKKMRPSSISPLHRFNVSKGSRVSRCPQPSAVDR